MTATTRRRFLQLAAAGAGLTGSLRCRLAFGDEHEPAWLRGIDDYVETAMARWKLPGLAIGVVRDGAVVHARGYGVRTMGKTERVDSQTVFPLSSCTKSFTAAAIGKLVDDGKVRWDDPIVMHLPKFQLSTPEATSRVTIRHALTHRSGLPTANMLWRRGDFRSDEIVRRLRYLEPVAAPGERFIYNNNMYLVLGQLLERVRGRSWADFLRKTFFRPLDMTSTTTDPAVVPTLENLATPHLLVDGKAEPIERHIPAAVAPAGSIHSNVRDVMQWLKFQLEDGSFNGKRILSRARMTEMHTAPERQPDPPPGKPGEPHAPVTHYGLGWFFNEHDGHRVVEHSGTQNGFASWIAMLPDKKLGVAVFGNAGHTGLVPAMKSWIFDAALEKPRRDWSEEARADYANNFQRLLREAKAEFEAKRERNTRPSVPPAQCAGDYRSERFGLLRISFEKDQLTLRCGARFDCRLEHWQHDSYRALFPNPNLNDWLVTFLVKDGAVVSLRAQDTPWAPAWYDDHDDLGEFVRV